jgi:hypothetical protein
MVDEQINKEPTGKELLKTVIQALLYIDSKYNFASGEYFSEQEAEMLKSILMESVNVEREKIRRAEKEHATEVKVCGDLRAAAVDDFIDALPPNLKKKVMAETTKSKSLPKKAKSRKKTKIKV